MMNKNILKKKNRRKAFTLVEILLAIFVLEVGLLGVAGFYAYSLNITKMARNDTTASSLAAGLLDEQLENSYDNLAVGAGTKTNYITDVNDPFYSWQKKIDIAYIDSNLQESATDTNMKKITVTVYWQFNGQEKSFQIATIKARH